MNYSQEEMQKRYTEEMINCDRVNVEQKNVYSYLGSLAAEEEWKYDPIEASKKFVTVSAYKKFQNRQFVGLLGRTGTGKTSIIKKIKYDIKMKQNKEFEHVVEISLENYIRDMPNYAQLNLTRQTLTQVEKNLDVYIKLSIMKHVIANKKNFISQKGDSNKINTIEKYLNHIGIKKDTDILSKILKILADINFNGGIGIAVNVLAQATLVLTGDDYDDAMRSLMDILSEKPLLVFVDTLEQYDIQDEQLLVIIRALVMLGYKYAWNFKSNNIFIKYAMPSEIYTHIREMLPAKFLGRELFIEWNYKDLVKMVAIKFYYFALECKDLFKFVDKYKLIDLYEKEEVAINIMYEILPQMCPATLALKFDTLAYCIRHTQKKPRQLLLIIDALIQEIVNKNDMDLLLKEPDKVRYLIHSVQEEMIMDSIAMYRDSIPHLLKICSEILNEKNYQFSMGDLEKYIRVAQSWRKGTPVLSLDDVKRVLIESGLVGLQEDIRYIPENSRWFENEKVIRILNASFEYQIKGSLIYNKNSIMLVHPMCYEYFKCKISKYTMVYPDKDADPADFLYKLFDDDKSK